MVRMKKINKNPPRTPLRRWVFSAESPTHKSTQSHAPSTDSPHPPNNISPKNIAILPNLRQKVLRAPVSPWDSRSSHVVRSRFF